MEGRTSNIYIVTDGRMEGLEENKVLDGRKEELEVNTVTDGRKEGRRN